MLPLPFKLNQAGRHHIPKQTHRVTNWPAYDASLRQRGSLTGWVTDEAIQAWAAEVGSRGGQPRWAAEVGSRGGQPRWAAEVGSQATHDPRRPALVLTPRHPDGSDAPGCVPLSPAPNRRPDRLPHAPARA